MKHGRKLKRKQIELLENVGLEPNNYLVERKTSEKIGFINTETGKVEYFRLDGSRC